MSMASSGLLAALNSLKGLVLVLVLIGVGDFQPPASHAMSVAGENRSELAVDLFALPTRIDEDDLLLEYGRFMLSAMNRSVDPCEDFYEYSCGNWKNASLVPAQARNDTFLHAIQLSIDRLVTAFLQNNTNAVEGTGGDQQQPAARTSEEKAKMFFRSCVTLNQDMAKGYAEFQQLEEFKVMPTPTPSKDEGAVKSNQTQDWMILNFQSRYGLFPFLPLKVHYATESRRLELMISAPTTILGNADLVQVQNLTRDFKILDEVERKQFEADFEAAVRFEKNFTAVSAAAPKRNETEKLSLGEFLKVHAQDKLNWTRYFEVAFNGTAHKDWRIHNTIGEVDALQRHLERTDAATLRAYVRWRHLLKFYYLWKADFGNKSVENTCREHTEQYFNYALLPWFIEQTYDADRRADILLVARSVKQHFYDLLDKYSWLDEETRSGAKTKLRSMDLQVGYSDEMRHRTLIDQIYGELNITGNWYANLFAAEANRARVRLKSVNKAVIPPLMSTRSVNAYYADFLNLVFVTVGITQLPFYHPKFPASLKFGGIGNIIGHEMAHGFDSYCYQFNYDGKKQNWWSAGSLRNFRERYQCLEAQYNKFIYRGVATNGTLTSGDNIADNVGTRIAYQAYVQAYGKAEGHLKPLPGLDYNNKQLYFLKFAQTWCTGKDEAYKVRRMRHDAHAYEEFRVAGTLSNMPEFAEAFQCKLGSDMNPLKKCVVW